jgi:hypothetical protein
MTVTTTELHKGLSQIAFLNPETRRNRITKASQLQLLIMVSLYTRTLIRNRALCHAGRPERGVITLLEQAAYGSGIDRLEIGNLGNGNITTSRQKESNRLVRKTASTSEDHLEDRLSRSGWGGAGQPNWNTDVLSDGISV